LDTDWISETQSMLRDYIAHHIRIISSLPQTQRGRALWAHLAIDGYRLLFKQVNADSDTGLAKQNGSLVIIRSVRIRNVILQITLKLPAK